MLDDIIGGRKRGIHRIEYVNNESFRSDWSRNVSSSIFQNLFWSAMTLRAHDRVIIWPRLHPPRSHKIL